MTTKALFAFLCRGVKIAPERWSSRFYCSYSPVVLDFGYLRVNRWWWHNLHCRFAWIYRLHYGHWPLYREWDNETRERSRAARARELAAEREAELRRLTDA